MNHKKRLKILTYPKFQLSVLGSILFADFSIFSIISYRIHVNFDLLKSLGKKAGLNEEHLFFESIKIQEKMITNDLLIVFFASLLFTIFFTLYLSNKLTGPILRLRSYLEGYLAGKTNQELSFRENDYFTDIPPLLNKVLKQKKQTLYLDKKDRSHEDD